MRELWQHQKDVLPDLLEGNFGLLWEPGTGKTAPVIATARKLIRPHREDDMVLYVSPAAVRLQVAHEARALAPELRVAVIKTSNDLPPKGSFDLAIISYDLLARKAAFQWAYRKHWRAIVIDEAHFLKSPRARRTVALYGGRPGSRNALISKAERVWWLSGTPMLSDPSDMWTHLSRLIYLPERAPTFNRFLEMYCHTVETEWGPRVIGAKNTVQLRNLLRPHVSLLRKEDVLDLPDLIVDSIPVTEAEPPRDVAPRDFRLPRDDDEAIRALLDLSPSLMRLRHWLGLAKVEDVAALADTELSGGVDRMLLVAHHRDVIEGLKLRLAEHNPLIITGDTPMGRRDQIVQAFNKGQNSLLIGQIQAVGTGLNLQGGNRLVFAEYDWTPSVNQQVIGRLHRAGQTRSVHVSFCSVADSLDERIAEINARKLHTIDRTLVGL